MAPVSLIFFSVPVGSWRELDWRRRPQSRSSKAAFFGALEVPPGELSSRSSARSVRTGGVQPSIPDFNIASRRVLQRRELSAAGLARRNLGRILRLEPLEPIRPPGARMLSGFGEPFVEIAAARLGPRPILIFHLVWGIDDARHVARAGRHETHRPTKELAAEQARTRRGDVILACG